MLQHQQKPRLSSLRTAAAYGDDVSPPDSPRTNDSRGVSQSPNISPVTDAGSAHRFPAPRTSNIPLPRQTSNGGTAAYVSGWREKIAAAQAGSDGKIKWDSYSGDPTGLANGLDSTTRPKANNFEVLGTSTSISALQQPRPSLFGVSLKKTRKAPAAPRPKEEWRGVTGGDPILPPIEQKPNPTKQFFPSPMQRRQKGGFRQAIGMKSQGQAEQLRAEHDEALYIDTQFQPEEFPNESDVETPTAETPIEARTIPPRGDSRGQPAALPQQRATWGGHDDETLPQTRTPRKSTTEPITHHATESIHRKPITPRAHTPEPDVTTEPLPKHSVSLGNSPAMSSSPTFDNGIGKQFSTMSISSAITEQPFEEPELPKLPRDSSPTESVLNRRRPIQAAGYLPRRQNPSRKPTPSERDNKSLPTTPADEATVDRVTLLDAKISTLNKRKANIQLLIDELTNVVRPDSIAYDKASRLEIKKTVESLKAESATVTKEIHETGLKLHRAMKKRDDAAAFEPTGLWVRRVTE